MEKEKAAASYILEESRCEAFGESRCDCGYCNIDG